MKKAVFLIITFISLQLHAQDDTTNVVSLEDLTSPNTPAFTLLGLNPVEVNRPTSTKPLMVSLANAYHKGGLADNVAVEFSPFWIFPHPDLTFDKYYRSKVEKDSLLKDLFRKIGRNISQSSTLSLATGIYDNNIDTIDARNAAAGLRFQILAGKAPPAYDSVYSRFLSVSALEQIFYVMHVQYESELGIFDSVQSKKDLKNTFRNSTNQYIGAGYANAYISTYDLKILIIELGEERIEDYTGVISNATEADSAIQVLAGTLLNEQEDQVKTLRENESINSRVGWIWEVAGARSAILPTNELDYSIEDRYGIWSTLTYRTYNQKNDFSLMFRRMGYYRSTGISGWDIGVSYVLSRKKYNVNFEAILRYYNAVTKDAETGLPAEENGNTSKFSLSFQYLLTDYINLSATIAKDFEGPVTTSGNLFTLVNLNFLLPEKTGIPLK